MKLIIDIPEERHDEIHSLKFVQYGLKSEENKKLFYLLINAVQDATSLEKHDEEVIKETVESIWGKPPYTEVLDSIKAKIEECKQYRGLTGNPIIDKHNVGLDKYYDLGLEKAVKIIDKYRKESEE